MNDMIAAHRGELQNVFSILIVDDEELIRQSISHSLRSAGFQVTTAENGADALRIVARREVDLVLLDINMPGHDGLETLKRIKRLDRDLAVAIMTGYGTIERAVDATRNGALEFISKPFSLATLTELIGRVEDQRRPRMALERELLAMGNDRTGHRLITGDPVMRRTIDLIDQVAPLPSTVLIEGESGTGKELVAREIHARSRRAQMPFIAFNCAAVPEPLLESELFGYERGAFTGAAARKEGYFEAADGGTLFIDEIAEISTDLQTKLLRVIQERAFRRVGGIEEIATDVRIIAATNRDLEHEVVRGRFREDLYYRINVMRVAVPPLRERPEDIRLLSQYFVEQFARSFGKKVVGLQREVVDLFLRYRWSGNVRELQNVVERAVAMARGREISLADLPSELFRTETAISPDQELKPFQEAKHEFEAQYLARALEKTEGNVALAARLTGISRQHLYDKLARLHIEQTTFRRREEPDVVA